LKVESSIGGTCRGAGAQLEGSAEIWCYQLGYCSKKWRGCFSTLRDMDETKMWGRARFDYLRVLLEGLAAGLELSLIARQRPGDAYLETAARSGGAASLLCEIGTKLKWGVVVMLVELESQVRGV
jgi:hypothetical protein